MNNSQLFFKFDSKTYFSKHDIIVGEFNKAIVEFLFQDTEWLSNMLYIYGVEGVGKSFIARIFIKEKNGVLISLNDIKTLYDIEQICSNNNIILLEDIHNISTFDEINLFNLYNTALAYKTKIIFTSNLPINEIDVTLPDLSSRLSSFIAFKISNPDDSSLRTIFFKMLSDKQLNVSLEVIDYILKRIQRDCSTLQKVVCEIENFTMKEKKTLNLSTVKNIKLDFMPKIYQ